MIQPLTSYALYRLCFHNRTLLTLLHAYLTYYLKEGLAS